MSELLYDELTPWYRLIDPLEEHFDEAASYLDALLGAGVAPGGTVLELGAGAGHNAYYLKRTFTCSLTDLSPAMLELSRAINPECEHQLGDMRSLRLERQFDAVFVHDAVMYMLSEVDLRQALETAFVHTRPGGAALIAPDCFLDTFQDSQETFGRREGEREMHCLEWAWDPDRSDSTYVADYVFMLRTGADLKVVHDRHVEGLFSREAWRGLLTAVGFVPSSIGRPRGDGAMDEIFLCRKPA